MTCTFQAVDADEMAFTPYKFKGVVPWVNLESPVASNCCLLPSSKVLCIVTDKMWSYIPTGGGTLSLASYVEHARLFDRNGMVN